MNPSRSDGSSFALFDSLPLALALFLFWIVLSGKLDAFHLGAGFVSSLAIAYASGYVYRIRPSVGPEGRNPFATLPLFSLLLYLPWLSWQILVSAFQIAQIVLKPKIEIEPHLFRFSHPLPHNLARATLANSITLTPGTVTIDVRGDEYLVHGLTKQAEEDLTTEGPGSMTARVSTVFPSV